MRVVVTILFVSCVWGCGAVNQLPQSIQEFGAHLEAAAGNIDVTGVGRLLQQVQSLDEANERLQDRLAELADQPTTGRIRFTGSCGSECVPVM